MIGKVIGGQSFTGTVNYVMKKDSQVLDFEGVNPLVISDMVSDFQDQAQLNPRVKNKVGHISLSFSEQGKSKLTNEKMAEIAKEYMQKMGITNTQFLIVRHHDAPHPHFHIVYNRVDNNGKTITDSNIRWRNTEVCKELTETHGLYFAKGKENVREDRLREPDKTKYEIYNAIKSALPNCSSWNDLEQKLNRECITMEFKFKGSTDIKEGVKFTKNGLTFSGSKIDQRYSYSKLNNHFNQLQKQQPATPKYSSQAQNSLKTAVNGYNSAFGKCFSSSKGDGGSADFSAFGAGSIPLPPSDFSVGISAAQLQRQPGESPEQHIARITALINSVAAAMNAQAEERKSRQRTQVKKSKIRL